MFILLVIVILLFFFVIILSSFQSTSDIIVTVPSEVYYTYFNSVATEYNNSTRTSQDIVIEIDTLENTMKEIGDDYKGQTDMFFVPSYFIPLLAEEGVILPIEYQEDNYSKVVNKTTTFEEQKYMLPFEYAMPVFIYDPSYYEVAPTAINDLKPEDWAANFYSLNISEIFIYQLSGYIYAFDNTSNTNTPESVDFFTELQTYYKNKIGIWSELTEPLTADKQIVDAYINDEIQAMIVPATYLSELTISGVQHAVADIPTIYEGSESHATTATYGLVVNSNTEEERKCQEFIAFLEDEENMLYFINSTANISPYLHQSDAVNTASTLSSIEEIYTHTAHYQATWLFEDMIAYSKIMEKILLENADVNQSLEQFDEQHLIIVEGAEWRSKINNN